MKDVVILEGARTAFGSFGGGLKDVSAIELGVIAAQEAIQRAQVDPQEIDQTVVGNVIQSSSDAIYMGRHVGLKSGLRQETSGLTVNRLCGSGLQAIITGAESIRLGQAQLVLTGGTENMSQVPHVIRGARWGLPLGQSNLEDYLWEALYDPYGDCSMAMTAENLAVKYAITRETVDEFALRSNTLAVEAMQNGKFAQEIVPVIVPTRKGDVIIDTDEHPKETSMERLGNLKPRFKQDGVVTAGNASGINDGAAMVVISSADYAKKNNLKPIARLVSYAVVGVDPKLMGIGPAPAILAALKKANMTIADLDLIEINEAFAAQYLACRQELDFDPELGNVNGGAVALGHPLGASGARITLSLVYELSRRNKKYGATALCIGGGQGIAAIWERL